MTFFHFWLTGLVLITVLAITHLVRLFWPTKPRD